MTRQDEVTLPEPLSEALAEQGLDALPELLRFNLIAAICNLERGG